MQLHEWKLNWKPPPDSVVQYKRAKKRYDALKSLVKKTPHSPLALSRIQEMGLWVKTAQEVFEDALESLGCPSSSCLDLSTPVTTAERRRCLWPQQNRRPGPSWASAPPRKILPSKELFWQRLRAR